MLGCVVALIKTYAITQESTGDTVYNNKVIGNGEVFIVSNSIYLTGITTIEPEGELKVIDNGYVHNQGDVVNAGKIIIGETTGSWCNESGSTLTNIGKLINNHLFQDNANT